MNGYFRYKDLDGVSYHSLPPVSHPASSVRDKYDDMLDIIFGKDINGWPSGSFSQYLSEKTSSEVRQFIQDYIMTGGRSGQLDLDSSALDAIRDLPTDFIAQTSRNRYESIEQYETRISEYVNQLRAEEGFQKRLEEFQSKLNEGNKKS